MELFFTIYMKYVLLVNPLNATEYVKTYQQYGNGSDTVKVILSQDKSVVQSQSFYHQACPCKSVQVYHFKEGSPILDSIQSFPVSNIEQYNANSSSLNYNITTTKYKIISEDSLEIERTFTINDRRQSVKINGNAITIKSETYVNKWVIENGKIDSEYVMGLDSSYYYVTKYYVSENIDSSKYYVVSSSGYTQHSRSDYFEYNQNKTIRRRRIVWIGARESTIEYAAMPVSISMPAQPKSIYKRSYNMMHQLNGRLNGMNENKKYGRRLKIQ